MFKNSAYIYSFADGFVQYLLCYVLSDFLFSTLVIQHAEYYFLALLFAVSLSAVSLLVFLPIKLLAEQGYKKAILSFVLNILFFAAAACFDYYCRGSGIHIFIFEVYPLSASEGLLSLLIIISFAILVILMRIIYCGIALSIVRKRRIE